MIFNSFEFNPNLNLHVPLEDETLLLNANIKQVDRVGFDLTVLEQEYYKINGFDLNKKVVLSKDSAKSSWDTIFQDWILEPLAEQNIFIDHSGLYITYPFAGEAKQQLQKYIPYRPELAKLINLKGKVGFDVCIDYIKGEDVIELVHLEYDFGLEDYSTYLSMKKRIERLLISADWESIKNTLSNVHHKITNDFRANLLGVNKAFVYYNRL